MTEPANLLQTPPLSRTLEFEELVELWHRQDEVFAGKEEIFVPVAVGIVPVTLIAWKDVTYVAIILAGAVSCALFLYLLLIARYYGKRQDNYWARMGELRSDFATIMGPSKGGLRQRPLRWYLLGVLATIWVMLASIKYREPASPTSIPVSIAPTGATIVPNDSMRLLVSALPGPFDRTWRWRVSDSVVATVASDGLVRAKRPGTIAVEACVTNANVQGCGIVTIVVR